VPYIPTPKENEHQNNAKLCIPNLIVCAITIIAIFFGVSYDSSPYSAFMAGFGLTNVAILLIVTIMAQEKFLNELTEKIKNSLIYTPVVVPLGIYVNRVKRNAFAILRSGSVILAVFILAFSYGFKSIGGVKKVDLKTLGPPEYKDTGGFYTGIYDNALDINPGTQAIEELEKELNTSFSLISFHQSWGQESLEQFPMKELQKISNRGSIPMITWEPHINTFTKYSYHPEMAQGLKTCMFITQTYFDVYIKSFAEKIKEYGEPIFIRFMHEPENPFHPWGVGGNNTPKEYKEAYRHVVKLFLKEGVHNVTWVWNPATANEAEKYFPGDDIVDWIGLSILNYGEAGDDEKWKSFSDLYTPYREVLKTFKKPVMIAELGSTSLGGEKEEWLENALWDIQRKFKEIKSAVIYNSKTPKLSAYNESSAKKSSYIDWSINSEHSILNKILAQAPFNDKPFEAFSENSQKLKFRAPDKKYKSPFYKGEPGNYELLVDGEPFYIKGLAYNTAHDWRDGKLPLTRRQVKQDLGHIKDLGVNTIRRYAKGVFDRNILKEAEAQNLKVMYGFWLDPEVDYYRDTNKLLKYINQISAGVKRHKNSSAVLGWGIGNETWGILKNTYSKPYLTKVRNQYVKFVEHLAQIVHEIDPDRPVFTTSEHEENYIAGEIHSFHRFAPSIDIYSVNSYYEEQISALDGLIQKHDPGRPYLISEFGPKGYWRDLYTCFSDGRYIQDSDYQNALLYKHQWLQYVEANRGKNIGGIAYCWRDRLEGTLTWYGITDLKGRFKPQYHALKAIWNDKAMPVSIKDVTIKGETKKLVPGKEYIFELELEDNAQLKTEWLLQRDEYLGEVSSIVPTAKGRAVKIKLPKERSNYRLYVFVSDGKGNVVTASKALNVAEE
jgi:cellulose synthase (UDP-forming)